MGKKSLLAIVLLALVVGAALYALPHLKVSSLPEKNILFVGNSYTFTNEMPRMVEQMLNATPQRTFNYRVTMLARGGAKLADHVREQSVTAALNSKKYDFVFLQEQSTTPFYTNEAADSVVALGTLANQVKTHGAQAIIFGTWARKAGNEFYTSPQQYANLRRPRDANQMTLALDAYYKSMSQRYSIAYLPLGVYWAIVLQRQPDMNMYHPDGSHPSVSGSYLMALVAYRAIMNNLPADVWHPRDVSAAQRDTMLKVLN